MPKSNLLAMLAAYVTSTPIRLNVFTAQTWVTRSGISAKILKQLDKLIATLASHSFVDSTSQRDFLLKKGIIEKKKTSVLANGSLGGVDLNKFRRNEKVRTCMRKKSNLTDDDIVILYMSRLTKTKGAWVVADVFPAIAGISKHAHLIVVGPEEEQGARRYIKESCSACKSQLHIHNRTNTPEDFFSMADILWVPSLNEGFGLVVINAAASGIPSIGSNIYGLQDSISNEETGLLHKVADKNDIVRTFNRILHNQTLRLVLGNNALERTRQNFSKELFTKALIKEINHYCNMLRKDI
ncbi:MAG: glycosyltransferase family 4 protein [Desulfocapsa sp.]|nr:glycosyltransferase family 4 protein [Desulfocapsa sp.]